MDPFAGYVIVVSGTFAQARLATAEYNKTIQPAVQHEIPFPEKIVNNTIDDKLGKLGFKGKEYKGYMVYKAVRMTEMGTGSYDLYFKTERKSKRDKDITIVTMLVSSGYDQFIGDTSNAQAINGAKAFLNNLIESSAAADLEIQIKGQEDALKKANKKYDGLVEDGENLQKKKAKLENEIIENTQAQAAQKTEAEKQQQILDNLKARRK